MIPARQLVAVVALGLAAAGVGFAGAAWLAGGRGAAVPPPAPAPPPSDPLEAELPPPAPAAPPDPAPARRPPPARSDPRPPVEPKPAPAAPQPPPRVEPEVPPRPAPDPATAPEPLADPDTPSPAPPPSVTAPPPDPPAGVRIPGGEGPTGWEPARRALAGALAAAPPGSTTAADLRRQLALWAAVLGPDAAPAPAGRRVTVARALRANAWWYARRAAPADRTLLVDPDGIILTYRPGQGFAVNPVATTGRWRDLNADVPAPALAAAMLPMGAAATSGDRAFALWEYYDLPGDPAAVRPGASGMAQARVALLMAHALAQSGDVRFSQAALAALAALTVPVDRGGALSMVAVRPGEGPAPWYVERAYPGEDPWTGAALNGFMVTLLNLDGAAAILERSPGGGTAAATGARVARGLAERGAATLARHLPDHDTGSWSLYGLLTPGRPRASYLADLNYHCYHLRLLDRLAPAHPRHGFERTAERWRGYVAAAGARCPER